MNAVNDILNRIPMDQLADQLGTDQATAEAAARQAVASLVGGMQSNATDPAGEASLANALNQHSSSQFFTQSRVDLNEVDTADGEKIVSHVFGSPDAQPAQLGGMLGNAQVQKLLKMLAPIVIGYLAGKVTSGGFGDILGGILGGGQQRQSAPEPRRQGGGGLGDILGQVLGGGGGDTQPESVPQTGDSPFNTPRTGDAGPASPGTDRFPTSNEVPQGTGDHDQMPDDAREAQEADEIRRKEGGGGLGDILGDIFGKR